MKIKYFICMSVLFPLFIANVVADELFYQDDLANNYIASQFESDSLTRAQCSQTVRCGSSYTKQFYRDNNYHLVWSNNGQVLPLVTDGLTILEDSYQDGLNPPDYHIVEIKSLLEHLKKNNEDKEKIAQLDMLVTDAFFLYWGHLASGRVNNKIVYPNWIIAKRAVNLIDVLHQVLQSQNFNDTTNQLITHNQEYIKLKQQLGIYQQLALKHKSWGQITVGSKIIQGMHGDRVYMLQQRLLASGELKHTTQNKVFDRDLLEAVVLFQQNNGLVADGVVGKTTIETLNIPLLTRIKQIELNMDRFRYLPSDLGAQYIMVNIPNFSLKVIANDQTVLDMPVIVGRERGLQSCVLSSQITYLDINPYWYIPNSIALRDMLPKLKHNSNYLIENHIKMYTSYAVDGKEINSKGINWNKVESNIFPYKLRQEPGADNSLGRIKFIFQNDCGIYLHDTSTPQLFNNSKRDLSHGCIRIGKPIELATYLLQDKTGWDQEKILATINSNTSKVVTLKKPIDIHIIYATAWVNESGTLQFRNDIYGMDTIPYPIYLPSTAL